MNRHLFSALAAAVLAAACSQGPTSGLGGESDGDNNNVDPGGNNGPGGGSNNNNGNNGNGNGGSMPPPPQTGPGSKSAAGHKFFVEKVHPAIAVCTNCHANGTAGAPKFLNTDPDLAYQSIDGRGLIQTNSLLLSKGSHSGGSAPALDANQKQLITDWLALEAKDRAGGGGGGGDVIAKLGSCIDQTKFNAIGFQNVRTQPRTGENPNQCTGCKDTACRSCHNAGDGGFYMSVGSNLDKDTFAETQKNAKYLTKYFGLNGTQPIASNAIQAKSDAAKTDDRGQAYTKHPYFVMSDTVKANLDAFVQDAITKYNNKQCGQTPP